MIVVSVQPPASGRTYPWSVFVVFCNNLHGKRIQKTTNTLHGYVLPEAGGCTLTTIIFQIDNTAGEHQQDVKEK